MAGTLELNLVINTSQIDGAANDAARKIKSALDSTAVNAQASGRRIGDALSSSFTDAARRISSTLSDVGTKLSVGLTVPLAGLAAASIKAAADVDKTRQTLVALTGSVGAANAKLSELRKLAATSPGVTTSFASSLFGQFKALGTVADESINRIIKSIGRLNAVFTLPDPNQFARNLQQIFTQGFERADIKEAIGQVPIFEQILEQAFGTKDAAKLRKLKDTGKLTISTFLDGISNAVDTDQRFANVQESIASKFAKTKDQILVALAPLGESLLRTLTPALERIIPKIIELLDAFAKLPAGVQEAIVIFGLLNIALGPVLKGFASLLSLVTSISGAVAGAGGITAAIAGLNPVVLAIGGILTAGAIGWYAYRKAVQDGTDAIDQALAKVERSQGIFTDLQGNKVNRLGGKVLTPEQQAALSGLQSGGGGVVSGQSVNINAATGKPDASAPIVGALAATATGSSAALNNARKLKEALVSLERERVEQTNRILKAEGDARSAALTRQFDAGLISYREYNDARFKIQEESIKREIALSQTEAAQLETARSTAKGAEKIKIEDQLLKLYADQKIKIIDLTSALEENFDEYKKRNALPNLDLQRQSQEQVVSVVEDPRVVAARKKMQSEKDAIIAQDIKLIDIRRQQLEVENAIELGVISQADGRQAINALLREERDLRTAALEAEKLTEGISAKRVAEINAEIASIRNLGVELTATQRFMRGFNSAIETTGDAFERLGQGISQSFGKVGGLLSNLKNAFKQFFNDLLGLGIQRIFQQLFGGITAAIGGGATGGRAGGGGIAGGIGGAITNIAGGGRSGGSGGGGLLGNIFGGGGGGGGFITPGFGGGFAGFGGVEGPSSAGPPGGVPAVGQFGGLSGLSNIFKGAGGLFKGIGFGLKPGSGTGALAAAAPLLGLSLGASAGGSSSFGKILGGAGGALLGIGLTAAPAALLAGGSLASLGSLAALFSNPITAGVGAALLVGAVLLGRSKQRKSDEEQAGIWLQDAVNQIADLKSQASQGQVTVDQARAIFEGQILTSFTSQISTLKTKSVRDSRLTNQVRDLRNLFETTVIPAAQGAAKRTTASRDIIPEFATGGIVMGRDRGYDSVLAMVRPGEMVLTRQHQDAIAQIAGPNVFSRVGVPDAPQSTVNGMPAFAAGGVVPMRGGNPDQPLEVNLVVDLRMGTSAATQIFAAGGSTNAGRRVVVGNVRRARIDGDL
jgi:hypothetical protein